MKKEEKEKQRARLVEAVKVAVEIINDVHDSRQEWAGKYGATSKMVVVPLKVLSTLTMEVERGI